MLVKNKFLILNILIVIATIISSCSLQKNISMEAFSSSTFTRSPSSTPNPTSTPTAIPTNTQTATPTETLTPTSSPTSTSTSTSTPTITLTATPTATATYDFVYGVGVFDHAWCNYGPGSAYLYRYDIQKGLKVYIHNRNADASWLWVQPFDTNAYCWTHNTVLDIYGDVNKLYEYYHPLPITTFIGPLDYVKAYRNGNEIVFEWPGNSLSVDKFRGWLLELNLCQGGVLYWTAIQTNNTSYTVIDEPGCTGESGGTVRIAEKHGYTEPTIIPWPPLE